MAKHSPGDKLTILDAVDNLSSLAELDSPSSEEGIAWTVDANISENQERIKQTFRVLGNYLRHIYEKNQGQLKELDTQRGIQAIMVLAGEAAQKVDKFSSLFKGAHGGSVTQLKEFQDLQKFYLNKILRRFQASYESEAAWEAEKFTAPELMDAERKGLKNLETIRRDRDYELLLVNNDDGTPFFHRSIARHIQLIGEFDEGVVEKSEDNPLIKFTYIQDRDLQLAAQEIAQSASLPIFDFYKEAMRHKGRPFVTALGKSVMALYLTKNMRNLIHNATDKSCRNYFHDFHIFLREALQTEEYKRLLNEPKSKLSPFNRTLLQLSHTLCFLFFMRPTERLDASAYLLRLIQMGGGEILKNPLRESVSFWNHLLEDDENLRHMLSEHPNGPLLKALHLFQMNEAGTGFDPLAQGNYPSQLFTLTDDSSHFSFIRVPSPTHQEYIKSAEVIPEFEGFLRYLKGKDQKYLLINLQDRTGWQEHARCLCLEQLSVQSEFENTLSVVTLPKNSDFYLQKGHYHDLNDASLFITTFKDQIQSFEECGFYLPPELRTAKLTKFVNVMLSKIHHFFFQDEEHLSHKNRLDFIEIFYQFLILKIIEWTNPDTVSFSCKDGVDTGAAANATFFSFIRMMTSEEPFTLQEREQLLWLFFSPALTLRDREIEIQRFNRAVSSLAHMHMELDAQREMILSAFNQYYDKPFLTSLKIQFSTPN